MTNNIQNIINQKENKMKKLNKIAFSFYWKSFPYLDKEKQLEIKEVYSISIEEENNTDIKDYSISSAFDDMNNYIKMKKSNWILWRQIQLDWVAENEKDINKLIEGIIPWKTYTISWYTNTWKSQFLYFLLNKIQIKPEEKIFIFSTEVNKWLLFKYLVQSKYNLSNREVFNFMEENKEKLIKEFNNFYIFDNIRDINIIEKIVKKEKPNIVALDFVQWLRAWTKDNYEKHSYLAQSIQKIWIENSCTMLNVAQINASTLKEVKNGGVFTIKGAWEYLESSDVVLNLVRPDKEEPTELVLSIEKNKFGPLSKFYLKADFERVSFQIDDNMI